MNKSWQSLLERFDLRLLLLIAVILSGCWVYIELVGEVLSGGTQELDEWILRSLRKPGDLDTPIGPKWLTEVMRDITSLGSTVVLTLIVVAAAGYLLLINRYGICALLVIAASGAGGFSKFMKHFINRPRPDVVEHLTEVTSPSFPSGHSLASAAIFLTIGVVLAQVSEHWRVRIYFVFIAISSSILIGFSRMFLGVHYPSDVLAGLVLGYSWGLFCWLLAGRILRTNSSQ